LAITLYQKDISLEKFIKKKKEETKEKISQLNDELIKIKES